MVRKFERDQLPDNFFVNRTIPGEYINAAIIEIASSLEDEQILQTVAGLIDTADSELPNGRAIDYLDDSHPTALRNVASLAEEMNTDAIILERRDSLRKARKERRPEWLRGAGLAIIYAIGGAYVPQSHYVQRSKKSK
jgi:hypothetical protein